MHDSPEPLLYLMTSCYTFFQIYTCLIIFLIHNPGLELLLCSVFSPVLGPGWSYGLVALCSGVSPEYEACWQGDEGSWTSRQVLGEEGSHLLPALMGLSQVPA